MRPEFTEEELTAFVTHWEGMAAHAQAYQLGNFWDAFNAVCDRDSDFLVKQDDTVQAAYKRISEYKASQAASAAVESVDSPEDPWAAAFAEADEAQLAREAALPKPATPEGRSEYHDPFAGVSQIKPDDAWMDELIAKDIAARAAAATSKRSAIPVGPLAAIRSDARKKRPVKKPSVVAPAAGSRFRKLYEDKRGPGKPSASPYAEVLTPARPRKLRPLGSVKKNRKSFFSTSQQEKFNKLCNIYGVKPGSVVKSRPLPRHTPLRRADSSAFADGPGHSFGDRSVFSTLRFGETKRPDYLHENAAEAREHIRQDLDKIDLIAEPGEKLTALHAVKELHSEYVTFNVLDNLGDSASDIHAEIKTRNDAILNSMLPPSNYDRSPAVPAGLRVSPIEVDTMRPAGSSYAAGNRLFSPVVQRSGEEVDDDDHTAGTGGVRPRGPGRSSGGE